MPVQDERAALAASLPLGHDVQAVFERYPIVTKGWVVLEVAPERRHDGHIQWNRLELRRQQALSVLLLARKTRRADQCSKKVDRVGGEAIDRATDTRLCDFVSRGGRREGTPRFTHITD